MPGPNVGHCDGKHSKSIKILNIEASNQRKAYYVQQKIYQHLEHQRHGSLWQIWRIISYICYYFCCIFFLNEQKQQNLLKVRMYTSLFSHHHHHHPHMLFLLPASHLLSVDNKHIFLLLYKA